MMQFGVSGEYKLEVTREDGTVTDTGWFKNLILNQGMDRLASDNSSFAYYGFIGTGNTAPAVTQTSLVSSAGNVVNGAPVIANSGSPDYAVTFTYPFLFAQGAIVGNMAEVGVGWANTAGNLFSRALITDVNGNPITLTILATDQLTIYYKLTINQQLTDVVSNIVLNGVNTTVTGRLATAANNYLTVGPYSAGFAASGQTGGYQSTKLYPGTSVLGPVTGTPTGTGTLVYNGTSNGQAGFVLDAYTAGSFHRKVTVSFGTSTGNGFAGGIGAIAIILGYGAGYYSANCGSQFQYQFSPPIAKDNTKTLSLTFDIAWARA